MQFGDCDRIHGLRWPVARKHVDVPINVQFRRPILLLGYSVKPQMV
jgi:hypothetical protein